MRHLLDQTAIGHALLLAQATSGKSRTLTLGAQVVEMKHAPQWMLLPSHRAAGFRGMLALHANANCPTLFFV